MCEGRDPETTARRHGKAREMLRVQAGTSSRPRVREDASGALGKWAVEGHAAIGARVVKHFDGAPYLGQVAGWMEQAPAGEVCGMPCVTMHGTSRRTHARTHATCPRGRSGVPDTVAGAQMWMVVYCDGDTDEMAQDELKESVQPPAARAPPCHAGFNSCAPDVLLDTLARAGRSGRAHCA